jgi:adenosylcobinamide-GDP ribazoletransferase
MNSLISAIQFITILPIGKPGHFDPRGLIRYFPVVGIIVGAMVSFFDQIALHLWSRPVVGILDVVFLAVITGAFHLDGLGDAADGMLGIRSREKALLIMKDSRVGAMGLVAILCGFSIKCAGIAGLDANRALLLIIIPSYARAGMIFGVRFLKYGRPDGGTGHSFFEKPLTIRDFIWVMIPITLSFFLGWSALVINIAFAAIVSILLIYFKRRMGCITGDMLGTMTEVTESLLFLILSAGIAI